MELETQSMKSVTMEISSLMMDAGKTASSCIIGIVPLREEPVQTPVEMEFELELRSVMMEIMSMGTVV